jgi:hypothetical protein
MLHQKIKLDKFNHRPIFHFNLTLRPGISVFMYTLTNLLSRSYNALLGENGMSATYSHSVLDINVILPIFLPLLDNVLYSQT